LSLGSVSGEGGGGGGASSVLCFGPLWSSFFP